MSLAHPPPLRSNLSGEHRSFYEFFEISHRIPGRALKVQGLDCLNGPSLLYIKPDRTLLTPIAPPQPGDFQVGG